VVRSVVVAGVVWAAALVWSVVPPTAQRYLDAAASAAQDSLSAAGTTLLVGQADLTARLLSPYTMVALDDAQQAAATAAQDVLAAPVPDDTSAAVREQLVPMLVAASDAVTAVQAAVTGGDEQALRAAVDGLVPVRDELDQFVQDQQ
jgi:hypothetical protein